MKLDRFDPMTWSMAPAESYICQTKVVMAQLHFLMSDDFTNSAQVNEIYSQARIRIRTGVVVIIQLRFAWASETA